MENWKKFNFLSNGFYPNVRQTTAQLLVGLKHDYCPRFDVAAVFNAFMKHVVKIKLISVKYISLPCSKDPSGLAARGWCIGATC